MGTHHPILLRQTGTQDLPRAMPKTPSTSCSVCSTWSSLLPPVRLLERVVHGALWGYQHQHGPGQAANQVLYRSTRHTCGATSFPW